ncbi:hypothetical protein H4R18_001588 [Coemansia javaensis]|uniref:FHA domain-containing protein n=1 Tax=Coemansia javaensis TaxID=2761396 RepID=A0A9W8HEM2_9FUNG|nr:hypothetical protein H4R18_001588 [Coemansia javaensis]
MEAMAMVDAHSGDPGRADQAAAGAECARPADVADWRQMLATKVVVGLSGRTVSIGRSGESMVQIGAGTTTVSRRHAEIACVGGERYELRVLGLNGVRVNGRLHARGACVELRSEDELNFIGIRYRFRVPAASEASAEPAASGLSAVPAAEAEDWWPEPMRKRLAGADGRVAGPLPKRARVLAEGTSELCRSSADTLVGSSEAGMVLGAEAKQALDDLPPSSPPPMHALPGFFGAASDDECADDLPDAIDIECMTPMPLPSEDAAPEPKKSRAQPAKENVAPAKGGAKGAAKARRPRGEQARAGRGARGAPAGEADDAMMASLRELLGIVDPSECLADSIDCETEEFLRTQPAEPVELAAGLGLADVVVETMVFSARTSHTISDLLRDIAKMEGHEGPARNWRHHLTRTLFHTRCFGRVERRVKDASDRRAEDRWYYDAARDDCAERRANFGGLARTARRCTLRDTQYFFKQVPKLPAFRYR